MKNLHGYFYDGKVNPERMPTFLDFFETAIDNMSRYNPALSDWEKNCLDVDRGIEKMKAGKYRVYLANLKSDIVYEFIKDGQPVLYQKTGKKRCVITKIN